MDYREIQSLTDKELHQNLREERATLVNLKFNHAVTPVENPRKISASRKLIARYLTEINKRKVEKQS